ncbi:MAG: hypothetical protein KGN02_05530 [bacterium]|nr:hypothetical protein [bacterium]
MVIALVAATLYTVSQLHLPVGNAATLAQTQAQFNAEPTPYRRPTTLAMNRRGAIVLAAGNRIVVRRTNGTYAVLPYPSNAVLRRVFLSYRQQTVPSTIDTIRNVAIADDGTPFVALTSTVDGAAFSIQEATFVWQGDGWRTALASPNAPAFKNVSVVAVDTPTRWLALRDELFLQPDELADASEPLTDEALLIDGARKRAIALGTPTALRGRFAVGYDFGFAAPGLSRNAPHRVTAWSWSGRDRTALGRGVAWSVNASGEIVGDDRSDIDRAGRPVVWRNGKRFELSDERGSAFGIADDGTIVGQIGSRAFIANARDPQHRVRRLDDLLTTGGWRIRAAYAISDRGSIVALASHGSAPSVIVELDPAPTPRTAPR